MRNPKELRVEELPIAKGTRDCLTDVSSERIIELAFFHNLTRLKGIGPKRSEEIIKALKKANFIPGDPIMERALRLYTAITRDSIFNCEICPDAVSRLPEILDGIFESRRCSGSAMMSPILRRRFGLDGEPKGCEEIGRELSITRERVRVLEENALKILRHPLNLKKLREVFVNLNNEDADSNAGAVVSMESSIATLGLTVRSYNCLYRAHICSVADLTKKSLDDLREIRNLGQKCVDEVISKLHEHGFKLADEQ